MKCPRCGWENAEYVAYCGHCGESVINGSVGTRTLSAEARVPIQGRTRRSISASIFSIVILVLLLIRIIMFGGGIFDIALIAIMTSLAIVPYLISRHRRNQEALLSAHPLKHLSARHEREPLKGVLHDHLVRIEGNWIKKCESFSGRLARWLRRRDQAIGFSTEREQVTLVLSWDRRISLTSNDPSRHDIDMEGSEEGMLALLENARDIRSIPSSIRVRVRGRDPPPQVDYAVRDGAAKMLRTIFE